MKIARKKVLFLITKATWGGAQRYVYDLATHLPPGRYSVAVAYGEAGALSQKLREKKIALHALPSLGRDVALVSDVGSFFQILALVRGERPDVLHVNSSKAAALGALAGRMAGVRRILFTAHGWPFKEDRGTVAKAAIYLVSWLTAFLSHATIVVSKTDETIGKRMPFLHKKIHYVPLGIEVPHFLSREEASQRLHIDTPLSRIVSVGELTHNKGHCYAIDAVARLKDRNIPCHYFIVGDGDFREQLEEYAIEKEVETRITFCGFVENVAQYLKAFDVFLLPSLKEGTPYVLLEAASAGLPIVSTNIIDASFAQNATLVPPKNSGMLAEALEQIIEQPNAPHARRFPLEEMMRLTTRLYT